MPKVDLHIHSAFSDGSDSASELCDVVRNNNLEIVSITDHDTVECYSNLGDSFPENIKLIKGIELTCKADYFGAHILGYDIDLNNDELLSLIEKGKVLRRKKLEKRIQFLKDEWNIILNDDELNWLYTRKSVVKIHVANILVNRGLAVDNLSAIKKYLEGCKTGVSKFDAKEAINIIKKAGGIAIWAHPIGGEGKAHIMDATFLKKLDYMKSIGIDGLECFYSRYNSDEIEFLLKCANENNLLVSSGSDYHGLNKDVEIGQLNVEKKAVDFNQISLLHRIK
ncbi:MAG: PHP domain-containing protein [Cyanobacteria bacterium SIG30]|nr:PHP domain-containing protein [Cyanobacteria bacterium SIG30]